MDMFYLFLGAGALFIYFLLEVDKQQRKRLKNTLKHSTHVQPLLMMQSAGNKLNRLQAVLANAGDGAVNTTPYKRVSKQLKETVTAYNNGKLPVDTYHSRLEDMINTIEKHDNGASAQ